MERSFIDCVAGSGDAPGEQADNTTRIRVTRLEDILMVIYPKETGLG